MKMKELYEKIEQVGCFTFSTVGESGEVYSRIAHFNGYDEGGLYFRTMVTKPYYRQLVKNSKLTVCGISNASITAHNDDGTTEFPPSFTIRIVGDIENITEAETRKRAETNTLLKTAVTDMDRYHSMKGGNFYMHAGKVEIYDVDFELISRDHKLYRDRFSFGGKEFNHSGVTIGDKCIACGACKGACTFKAIEEGDIYSCISNRCDECGDCINVCPVDAIELPKEF